MGKSLYMIVLVAWFLVLGESFVLFEIIIPASPRIHSVGALTLFGLAKVLMTLALGILWFVVIGWMRNVYVRSRSLVKGN